MSSTMQRRGGTSLQHFLLWWRKLVLSWTHERVGDESLEEAFQSEKNGGRDAEKILHENRARTARSEIEKDDAPFLERELLLAACEGQWVGQILRKNAALMTVERLFAWRSTTWWKNAKRH